MAWAALVALVALVVGQADVAGEAVAQGAVAWEALAVEVSLRLAAVAASGGESQQTLLMADLLPVADLGELVSRCAQRPWQLLCR